MDMEKMLEEYRQAQRIRIISKLAKKTMAAFVQFKNVVVQKGSGPRFQEVTREIRKGSPPDLGLIQTTRKAKGPFDRRTRRNSSYDCLDERSCDWTGNSDGDVRLRKLEALVDRLIRRESHSSENSQHVVRMAVKSDCIPEFLPGKPNQSSVKWVDKIDQLARVNKWDENTTIQLMQNRLTGLARTWYDNLTTYTHTWDEWKALLVKTFPDHHDFAATLRQLVNREKQFHESMTQYYFGKMNLLQACNITGKHAVSCLIDGLSDRTLRNGAKAGRYETPEELYTEYLSTLVAEVADNETKVADRRGKGFDRRRRPKTSGPSVRLLCPSDTQDCYFVECAINGKPLKGYIDTGCSIVTLRKATAIELQLEQRPSTQLIRGYAGGVTPALGEAEVTLTVDLITAKVTASIVEDRVQSVPVIIGQTILNRAGVTMVLRDNQIRLFDKHLAVLPGLDDLPSRKVALRSKEDVVIPSHTIGFIEVYSPETYDGDVYVEATTRQQPNHEYSIPGCITSTGGVISVRNAADSNLVFSRGQLLVRGLPCKLESSTNELCCAVTPRGRGQMERGRAVSAIYRSACTAPRIFETQDEGQRQCMGLQYRKREQGKQCELRRLRR
ncbi:hypothetical protein MTP99_012977 [Tenebrio molitor]|nr:hypothetical protein MTP99_012977 [Tenebrio molitor]